MSLAHRQAGDTAATFKGTSDKLYNPTSDPKKRLLFIDYTALPQVHHSHTRAVYLVVTVVPGFNCLPAVARSTERYRGGTPTRT